MNSTAKIYFFTLLLLLIANSLFSQIAPKYSNEFLSIGVGGRGLSMGNCVTASSNDISSIYWNPAGLLENKKTFEIGLMHSEYFAGIAKYDFIGASYKIDTSSALGFSMIRFGVDDIPNTLDLIDSDGNIRLDKISSFSVADYAFLFSYAHKLPIHGLSLGANVKIVRRIVGEFANSWGFGFDIAASYKYKQWLFGANLKDPTSTFNAWSFNTDAFKEVFEQTGNAIPQNGLELSLPRLIIGAGYKFVIKDKFIIYPEIDLVTTSDGKRNTLIKSNLFSVDPALGIELSYNNLIYVRTGFSNFQTIPNIDNKKELSWQPNIGIGLNFYNFKLDYAFTDIGNQSIALYSHIFSLSYSFNYNLHKSSVSKL